MTVDFSSADYWESRYAEGRNSGSGSYGRLSAFKARFLNSFVRNRKIGSVIEFGSGDGNQLSLADYPRYIGVDVSRTAIGSCRERFAGDSTKTFILLDDYAGEKADLSMSLDVIYHLVEDNVFNEYMARLFDSSKRYVILYASNYDKQTRSQHVRHRYFMDWILRNRPEFALVKFQKNPYPIGQAGQSAGTTSPSDFFVFEKVGAKTRGKPTDVLRHLRDRALQTYHASGLAGPIRAVERLAFSKPRVDLVTVVFNDELPLLAIQARSIKAFFPRGMLGSIIFVINEFDPQICRNYIERRIIPELGSLGGRVVIAHLGDFPSAKELSGETVEGWLSQQACKLEASRRAGSDYFLVLDAKHHFVRQMRPDDLFADGRARKPFRKAIDEQKPWLVDSLCYFGADPALADQPSPASVPPFVLHTATVRQMIDEIERREGADLLAFFSCKTDSATEFTLYYAYLIRHDLVDRHLVNAPAGHLDFRITTRSRRRAQLDQRLAAGDIWCFNVHRRRLAKLTAGGRSLIVNAWSRSGLFPSKERAATAVTELEGHFRHLEDAENARIEARTARRARFATTVEDQSAEPRQADTGDPAGSGPRQESAAPSDVAQPWSTHFDGVTQLFSAVKRIDEERALILRELIRQSDARDILGIGFHQGKSSAYIAAILEDLGRGSLVAIEKRDPAAGKVNLAQLLSKTGLSHRVKAIQAHRSVTWELQKMIADGGGPRFDFCHFDGNHTWDDAGFGFTLVNLLLRPGGVIVFTDIDWTIDRSPAMGRHPERAARFSADERAAQTVRRVWETLVPLSGYTDLREFPKVGWAMARKLR